MAKQGYKNGGFFLQKSTDGHPSQKSRNTVADQQAGNRSITFSEINHSAPICETSATKNSNSAILTPDVTQKRGIFAIYSAKTALANYLLKQK